MLGETERVRGHAAEGIVRGFKDNRKRARTPLVGVVGSVSFEAVVGPLFHLLQEPLPGE